MTQQRRLRLGDILDDYCPRERRITNHAVVAMIEDEVKQTRCTTCDADHEYKQAKVPPARRKKLEGAALGDPHEAMLRRPDAQADGEADADSDTEIDAEPQIDADLDEDVQHPADGVAVPEPLAAAGDATDDNADEEPVAAGGDDDGPVHRRLIRATLPRPEGQVPERKMPDFTMRQPGRGGFDGNKNGRHGARRPVRFSGSGGGGRSGQGQQGPRQGSGQGQRQGGGNRSGGGAHPQRGNGPGRGGGRKRGR